MKLYESLVSNVGIGLKAYVEDWARKHVLGYGDGRIKLKINKDGLISSTNISMGSICIDTADVPKQIHFGNAYRFELQCLTYKQEKLKNLDFLATPFREITIKNFDVSDVKLKVDAKTVALADCYQNGAEIIFKNPTRSQLYFSSIDSCRFVKSNCESVILDKQSSGFAYERWRRETHQFGPDTLDKYIANWVDIKDYPNIKYFYPSGTSRYEPCYKYEDGHWSKL